MIDLDTSPTGEPTEAEKLLGFRVREGMVWIDCEMFRSWTVPRICDLQKAVEIIEKLLEPAEMNERPQWQRVLDMLQLSPDGVTTGDFCSTTLSAEYRRAVSELRRKGWGIEATRIRQGSFLYKITRTPQ